MSRCLQLTIFRQAAIPRKVLHLMSLLHRSKARHLSFPCPPPPSRGAASCDRAWRSFRLLWRWYRIRNFRLPRLSEYTRDAPRAAWPAAPPMPHGPIWPHGRVAFARLLCFAR